MEERLNVFSAPRGAIAEPFPREHYLVKVFNWNGEGVGESVEDDAS